MVDKLGWRGFNDDIQQRHSLFLEFLLVFVVILSL